MAAFDKLAEQIGWCKEGRCMWGNHKGYLFTACQEVGFINIETILQTAAEQQVKNIAALLRGRRKELKIGLVTTRDKALAFQCPAKLTGINPEQFSSLLDSVVTLFQEEGIPPQSTCAECGSENNCLTAIINNQPFTLCETCYGEKEATFNSIETDLAYENKKYAIGFVGAFLGSLVGAIPWVIVAQLGFFVGILGFVIGIASLKGYKMLGGKVGPMTKWIVLLSIVLALAIAESATLIIEFIKEDIPVTLENFLLALKIKEIYIAAIRDMVISLIIAGLGIFPLFKQIKEEEKPLTIKRAGK